MQGHQLHAAGLEPCLNWDSLIPKDKNHEQRCLSAPLAPSIEGGFILATCVFDHERGYERDNERLEMG